ncbi:MAG: hypothetical protein IT440_08460 [Phycisphaeraceae bacterium]|nr:hypothetical protein [Phycisphaeraceae bacterium]
MTCLAAGANAQMSRLDPGQFIEGLRKQGLRELMRHLVESEPATDPVVRQQVLISTLRLDYDDALSAGKLDQARTSLDQALDATRKLIQDAYDHEQRPIWQTQLGEMLLFDLLDTLNTNAGQFVEFGVPTAAQQTAFNLVVPEALENLEDADVRFYQLQTELPKEKDHTDKRVNTGLWYRMMDEYSKARTRFALAHALLYAWLLPDSDAYFTHLGNNPKIVRQKKDIPGERGRLLALATQQLEDLIADPSDTWSIRSRCQCLMGRVKLRQQKFDEAVAMEDHVLALKAGDMNSLMAGLARAMALGSRNKLRESQDQLVQLAAHPLATSNLLMRLLTVDARHRVLLDAAARGSDKTAQAAAMAAAYEPYMQLLNDPALGAAAEPLRNYVHQRWMDNLPVGGDLASHPPVVVAAVIESLRVAGQNGMIESAQSDQPGLATEAKARLQRAIALAEQLLQRRDASASARAQTLFNQGLATYFLDTRNHDITVQAAVILTRLADQLPAERVSEQAIGYAVEMLHQLQAAKLPAQGRDEAYRQCVEVLLKKFPTTAAADNERYFYAVSILVPGRQWEQAAEVLRSVSVSQPQYFEAQRERLYCLVELARQDAKRWDMVAEEAAKAREEAERRLASSDPDQAPAIRNAAGHARLILADIAERKGELGQALTFLRNFEQDFLGDNELMRLGLGRRILLLVRDGKLDEASREATKMMQSFPDDAAPVVDRVLTDLDRQTGELRQKAAEELAQRPKQELLDRAKNLSEMAAKLANLLVSWAGGQGLSAEQMVPFQIILAKSTRASGQAASALPALRDLRKQFPNDADVIQELAESLYAVAGRDNLLEAAELNKILISGLPPDDQGRYPAPYWNAWRRYFQISEQLNENTDVIALRVRGLQASDDNLGGEPYKSELIRLMNKYAR